tara:strand:- start:29763 stop:29909 length:147 start_codon:yes stop_codon:yes gene_type:complete
MGAENIAVKGTEGFTTVNPSVPFTALTALTAAAVPFNPDHTTDVDKVL